MKIEKYISKPGFFVPLAASQTLRSQSLPTKKSFFVRQPSEEWGKGTSGSLPGRGRAPTRNRMNQGMGSLGKGDWRQEKGEALVLLLQGKLSFSTFKKSPY